MYISLKEASWTLMALKDFPLQNISVQKGNNSRRLQFLSNLSSLPPNPCYGVCSSNPPLPNTHGSMQGIYHTLSPGLNPNTLENVLIYSIRMFDVIDMEYIRCFIGVYPMTASGYSRFNIHRVIKVRRFFPHQLCCTFAMAGCDSCYKLVDIKSKFSSVCLRQG